MKNYSIFVVGLCLLFSAIGVSTQSFAFSEDDLKKLETTNECEKCDLSGVVINDRTREKPSMRRAKLSGADLSGAVLTWVRLGNADLSGANLTNAKIANTDLAGANLTGANLTNATIHSTNVRRANFKDAILVGLKVDDTTKENFEKAKNVAVEVVVEIKESGGLCTSELSVCKGSLERALEKKKLFWDGWMALKKKETEYRQTINKLKSEVTRNAQYKQYKQLYKDAMTQQESLTEKNKSLLEAREYYKQEISKLQNKIQSLEQEMGSKEMGSIVDDDFTKKDF